MKQRIVILTGAGMSAESGIKTFRDSDGLWENHRIEDVAIFSAWERNPKLVLDFYNERRRQLLQCEPNAGHKALVELEAKYEVNIITQNVDDLHESAGSTNVLHLHGELLKVRSTADERLVYEWNEDLNLGDTCELGAQLRPHIVWFGEPVPMIEKAADICRKADIFMIIGTSLAVYPAAGLVHYTDFTVPKIVIDPKRPEFTSMQNVEFVTEKASTGVRLVVDRLMN